MSAGETASRVIDAIAGMDDVAITTPANLHVLTYNTGTGKWINAAAQVASAPNVFSTIAVSGQSNVVADAATDTLTLINGSNIVITTNVGGDDRITFAVSSTPTFSTINTSGLATLFDLYVLSTFTLEGTFLLAASVDFDLSAASLVLLSSTYAADLNVSDFGAFGGRVTSGVAALTDGATINTNAALGNTFTITIAGNRTMAAPTNAVSGQKILYRITQDGTGSRTITWDAAFRFAGATAPTLTTTAAKTDYIGFIYNAAASKWDCVAERLNF